MQSFRTELENPQVEQDIIDLEKKIRLFKEGEVDEDRFRSLRLARGVYGQRQQGVQMVRIKIPFGKMCTAQLRRIADVSDQYANGNLHLTTRQDIQLHYVSLEHTPQLWAELEKDELTMREACGNTVRNITASAKAGIDPEEPFDVSPYAYAMFQYFLRNPICQEMGRKFKIAFSSSEKDSAFTFIHDLGLIPRVKTLNGQIQRGFKVLIGGGLGAQPHVAEVISDFLPEEDLIPFTESLLRVFDRYGERNKRGRARMKFLLKQLGKEQLLALAKEEHKALKHKKYKVDTQDFSDNVPTALENTTRTTLKNNHGYELWKKTNVFEQKQSGYYGVHIKIPLGNLNSDQARQLADITKRFAADDIRITVNQGLLLKFLTEESLPHLHDSLSRLGFASPGFDSTADITSCPGTDTCNLGISNSTGASLQLEKLITETYPDLISNNDIKIKISGCPNSCGQHGIASIGFHGSSIKDKDKKVLPALQVLLGGGVDGSGNGRIAEKIIKIPSKRATVALSLLLDDYDEYRIEGEYYADYYNRHGKMYFYHLLKPLANLQSLHQDDYHDWQHANETFKVEAGIGECAGVVIDLVQTLIQEADEKLGQADYNFQSQYFADAIYNAYSAFVISAKALLLTYDVNPNTQMNIIRQFDEHFVRTKKISLDDSFEALVLQIKVYEATQDFAKSYLAASLSFVNLIKQVRHQQLNKKSNV